MKHKHHAPSITFHIDLDAGEGQLLYPSTVLAMIQNTMAPMIKAEPHGMIDEGTDVNSQLYYGGDVEGAMVDAWGQVIGYWEIK